MISQADSEKPKKVAEFLLYVFPCIYKDEVYDLTLEILPIAIFDTLFDLALVSTRELISNYIDPLLGNEIIPKDPNLSQKSMETIFCDIERLIKLIRSQKIKSSRAPVIFKKLNY